MAINNDRCKQIFSRLGKKGVLLLLTIRAGVLLTIRAVKKGVLLTIRAVVRWPHLVLGTVESAALQDSSGGNSPGINRLELAWTVFG